jgi:hypothetical protein
MDVLTLALTLLAVLALLAAVAGAESRDGFDRSDSGRTLGR